METAQHVRHVISRRDYLSVAPVSASTLMLALAINTAAAGDVIHVKTSAIGAQDGSSWANAFTSLQAALAAAQAGDQLWVAGGTYTPAPPNGSRTISFSLEPGV